MVLGEKGFDYSATCDLLLDHTHLPYSIQRSISRTPRIKTRNLYSFLFFFSSSYFIIIKYHTLFHSESAHTVFIFTTINNRFQLNDTLRAPCGVKMCHTSSPIEPLPRFSWKKNFFFSIEHFPREKRSNNEKWHAFDHFRRI